MVYHDDDGDNTWLGDDAERVRIGEALEAPLTLTGSVSVVQFRPTGSTTVSPVPVTFDLCSDRPGDTGRRITISSTGHVSAAELVCP